MKLTKRVIKTQVTTTTTTLSSTFHELFDHQDLQPQISKQTAIDTSEFLDNSDSELVDLLKGHSLPTNRQQHRKLAKTLKLSPEHQQQVKELSKKTFVGDPAVATEGQFPEALDYVKQHWPQIKKCILERRPLYVIGAVQIGKTIIYNAIAYLAINGFTRSDGGKEDPLVDLAVIVTMNLTSSGDQNQKRSKEYLKDHRDRRDPNKINVFDINQIDDIEKGSVVHAICNGTQLNKVHDILRRAGDEDKKYCEQEEKEFKHWEILVIHDESDQHNPNLADTRSKGHSRTEDKLNILLRATEYVPHYCAVSATMLSDFAIYDKIGKHRYGDMIPEQIFHLPVDEHYKGLVKNDSGSPMFNPDFVRTGMKSEPKNGTHNPRFIAEKMFYHYNDTHTNPYGLPQIATANLTRLTKGHASTARKIAQEMNSLCPGSTAVVDFDTNQTVDVRTEFVVVTHNGEDKSEISPEDKIREIYDSAEANGIKLKGIVFVGGWKVSRAITFGTRDRDYAYCNLSFTSPPKGRIDREAIIQSARCSGRYSDLKTHVFYTTEESKAAIENYYNVFYGDFLPNVKSAAKSGGVIIVSDYITKFDITYNGQSCTQKAELGKSNKRRHMDITSTSKHRSTGLLSGIGQATRDHYINQGLLVSNQSRSVLALDSYWKISKAEYDQLIIYGNDNLKVGAFLQQKGINKPVVNRINNDSKNKTMSRASGLTSDDMRNLYQAQLGSVTSWQASTGEYVLYYYVGFPQGSSQKGIRYKLELDAQGRVKFPGHAGQTSEIQEPPAQMTSSNVQVGAIQMSV